MPANVTPEYEKAEQQYRQAASDEERGAALQRMLAAIPKHKGTEKMQADIKRRLSQLRREQQRSGPSKGPDPFHIPKSGAGQVVLAGPPNTGKSSLLVATTKAEAKVADYPFTTAVPQPGMWRLENVQLELVDTPPLAPDHVPAGLIGAIRAADVVCLVVAAGERTFEEVESVIEVLSARGLSLRTRPRNQFAAGQGSCRPGLIVVNKAELAAPDLVQTLRELYAGGLEVCPVSAHTRAGLEEWFRRLWGLLAMVRIYAKQPGRPPDLTKPFVLPEGSTAADLARQIHRDLPETMKFARLWRPGRFPGQQVHKSEGLQDGDIVEVHE
jgi:hypothetical protein